MKKGNYYEMDGEVTTEICDTITDNERVLDGLYGILNHRYLSLIEGQWDTTFIQESAWVEPPLEGVGFNDASSVIDQKETTVEFTLYNDSDESVNQNFIKVIIKKRS